MQSNYLKVCDLFKISYLKITIISNNIMPWISEWLYYYEIWPVTGEWYGGGIHPGRKTKL